MTDPNDPTDYKTEFEKLRNEVHRYRDFVTKGMQDAEAILRPYLTTAAMWGITPDHKFREIDKLPFRLMEDITAALLKARGGVERADAIVGDGQDGKTS